MKTTLLMLLCSLGIAAESPSSFDPDLQALDLPENAAPEGVSSEKIYAVQNRYSSLSSRLEVSVGGGRNFNAHSFLSSNQIDAGLRFYLTDRWFLNANGSYVFTDLTNSAQHLMETQGIVPDVAYVDKRADFMVGFHTFYGKIRFTADDILYFDHYVALGPGLVLLNNGNAIAAVGDTGFVAWLGKHFSFRIGVKDNFFSEQRILSQSMTHHILGHVDIGYLLGAG